LPDHDFPDQSVVLHDLPLHEFEVQSAALQDLPLHEFPDHEIPAHWMTDHVRIEAMADHAVISVADEGDGIAPEDHPFVFDRFFRARTDAARRSGGVGLGLFICRRLVEAMGGEISLRSQKDAGSTFFFTLPLATADARTAVRAVGDRPRVAPIAS
jgi:light-regulated signal transduction histidine kinase (bacteriophytochrome)